MAVTNNYQQKMQNAYDNATAADQSSYDSQTINNSSSRSAKQNLSIDDYEAQANNMLSTLQNNKSQQNQTQQNSGALITGTNADASALKNVQTKAYQNYYDTYRNSVMNGSKDTSTIDENFLRSIWQPEGMDEQYASGYYQQLMKEYGNYTPQEMYLYLSKLDANNAMKLLNSFQNGYTDYVEKQKADALKAAQDAQKAADAEVAMAANTKSYADDINAIHDAAIEQSNASIDYQTQTSVNDAKRSYEDQAKDYRDQYHTNTSSMYQNMDNAALNSRANGQFGGTATQNVAAAQAYYQQQRQQLATKQRQLADDTMYQVNKLRSQGEYDKADAVMKQNQERFSQLYEDAIRVDENKYSNWQYQTELDRADEDRKRQEEAADLEYRRQMGMTLLGYGIVPEDDILKDLGINRATATAYAYSMAGTVR